jgi:geranylgeranyl diphosphate synthase, type I
MSDVMVARPAHEVLAWTRQLVDPALREAVDRLPATSRRIAGYHFGWCDADGRPAGTAGAGKAIRPALALLAARATGGDPAAVLPAAVAVELMHNFSLIHDDVIDGDLTRRHRPTVWSVFGTGAAILAGNALLSLSLDVLAASGHATAPQAIRMLGAASFDLMEGQHLDLAFESRTDVDLLECLEMAGAKSAALLGCACALGAAFASARAERVSLLRDFGERLGLAFQLTDDLLGIWGDPAATGKPVHADLRRRKKSLPVVAALTSGTRAGEELAATYRRDRPPTGPELARAAALVDRAGGRAWSRARADELLAEAVRALRSDVDLIGSAAGELAALAQLVVHRDR